MLSISWWNASLTSHLNAESKIFFLQYRIFKRTSQNPPKCTCGKCLQRPLSATRHCSKQEVRCINFNRYQNDLTITKTKKKYIQMDDPRSHGLRTRHWSTKHEIHRSHTPSWPSLFESMLNWTLHASDARCCPQQPPQYIRSPPVNKSVSSSVQCLVASPGRTTSPRQNSAQTSSYVPLEDCIIFTAWQIRNSPNDVYRRCRNST